MPKATVPVTARRRRESAQCDELSNAVEGQIAEICRELAAQAKRMRQLQEQADELCVVIRRWAASLEANLPRASTSRGGRG